MKFIVSSSALLKELQTISGVQTSNSTLPILEDFLFDLKDNELKISASDLETTISVVLNPDMSEGEGKVAIPAKMLFDTIRTFAELPLNFSVNLKNFGVELLAGEGSYKLIGHDGNEYPEMPVVDDATKLNLQADLLYTAISKTIFATGNDELRLAMSGIFCELTSDDMTFVATDAHKLVRYRRTDVRTETPSSFIMSKKPLNKLKNILPLDDSEVVMKYDDKNAHFSFGNVQLTCRLIDEKFPNYDAVIPKETPNVLSIERIPLLNALRRVSIYGNQSTNQVRFKISGKELILSAEDLDFQNEGRERLSCSYRGDDLEIGFNSRFMIEMLNNSDEENVELRMSAPNRAGLLIPMNDDNENEDILMLVMPVMLNL